MHCSSNTAWMLRITSQRLLTIEKDLKWCVGVWFTTVGVMVTATIECRDAWRCATDEWTYASSGSRVEVRKAHAHVAFPVGWNCLVFRTQAIASRRHRTKELGQGHALAQKALIVATKRACFCRKANYPGQRVDVEEHFVASVGY
ncbi:hypothetical protein Efla_007069 [Eimeria flavescens]